MVELRTKSMKTLVAKPDDVTRSWYIVDADAVVLGRLAAQVARILRGKHKPIFTPHVDCGDGVIVVNAAKVRLTGKKVEQKTYFRHSGYIGGAKLIPFKRMLELGEGLDTIAINVSTLQLSQSDFVEMLKNSLELSGLPARYLEIEITESCLLENIEATISKLKEIRALGVRVAVDDFGTGYSSLQYLKRLPLDKLKIDQMFIHGLPNDENDVAIVRSLVSLSQELKLIVLAEGCETQAQAQFLQNESIYSVQGWLFCHALPQDEFANYTKHQNSLSREVVA